MPFDQESLTQVGIAQEVEVTVQDTQSLDATVANPFLLSLGWEDINTLRITTQDPNEVTTTVTNPGL